MIAPRPRQPVTNSNRRETDKPPTVTVHVPMRFRRRGGRKTIAIDGPQPSTSRGSKLDTRPDPVLAALSRAFYWRKLIDSGVHASLAEIARAEGINDSYASRILRLTLLAPEIVEAILNDQWLGANLLPMLRPFPFEWMSQRQLLSEYPGPLRSKNRRPADSQ